MFCKDGSFFSVVKDKLLSYDLPDILHKCIYAGKREWLFTITLLAKLEGQIALIYVTPHLFVTCLLLTLPSVRSRNGRGEQRNGDRKRGKQIRTNEPGSLQLCQTETTATIPKGMTEHGKGSLEVSTLPKQRELLLLI